MIPMIIFLLSLRLLKACGVEVRAKKINNQEVNFIHLQIFFLVHVMVALSIGTVIKLSSE